MLYHNTCGAIMSFNFAATNNIQNNFTILLKVPLFVITYSL